MEVVPFFGDFQCKVHLGAENRKEKGGKMSVYSTFKHFDVGAGFMPALTLMEVIRHRIFD